MQPRLLPFPFLGCLAGLFRFPADCILFFLPVSQRLLPLLLCLNLYPQLFEQYWEIILVFLPEMLLHLPVIGFLLFLTSLDIPYILGHTEKNLLIFIFPGGRLLLQPVLHIPIEGSPKDLLQDRHAVPGFREQQPSELPLGNHGDLHELFPGQSHDFLDLPQSFLQIGHRRPAVRKS